MNYGSSYIIRNINSWYNKAIYICHLFFMLTTILKYIAITNVALLFQFGVCIENKNYFLLDLAVFHQAQ